MRQKRFFVHLHSPSQYNSRHDFLNTKARSSKSSINIPSHNSTINKKLDHSKDEETYTQERILKITVASLLIFIGVASVSFYLDFTMLNKPISQIEHEIALLQYEVDYYKKRETELYNMFLTSAERLINQNDLDAAQEELQLALKLFPNGIRANVALYKVLALRCYQYIQHCNEALHYYYSLYNNSATDKKELNYLKRYLTQPNGELTQ